MSRRMRTKIRAWNQSTKKLMGNLMRSGQYLKFKGNQTNLIKNGAVVVEESISLFHGKANPIRHFSVNELSNLNVNSTPYYSSEYLYDLHQGSWEGRLVTVKKARPPYHTSRFVREIVVATQMATHNNAHKLLGCCLETRYPVLIYEWVQPKTLDDSISNQSLEWKDRLRIAWEISYVVAYLHTAFSRPIIHRDLKPDNVVLDQDSTVKLCDFSACISIPKGKAFLDDERLVGTIEYLDPTYAIIGKVSRLSDVYSFGVLLLQLLTGKRAKLSTCDDDHYCYLADWVEKVIKDNGEILDPFIIKNGVTAIEELQLRASIQLALFCLAGHDRSRPKMVEVATELKSMITSPESVPTITRFLLPKIYHLGKPQNTEKSVNVEQGHAHTSINSSSPTSFEDQVVDQVQCEDKKIKRTNKNDMMEKRMQTKKLVCLCSEPLQYLVGTEVFKNLPNCKELHNLMACQPHETSIAVAFSAESFQYHDTKEEFQACFTVHDVVQFLSMQCLNSSCLQLFMRYLDNKCKLVEVDSIAFMCPKRLAMVKNHLIFTSQYIQYAFSELQSKSYILAPYYHEKYWTLIVVCPRRHIVLFFDPMGNDMDGPDGLAIIKRRMNMASRSLQPEKYLHWRPVQVSLVFLLS